MKELDAIDSLTISNVDSARVLLRAMKEEMKQAPSNVARYYDLVRMKAKDRSRIKHTSDSTICKVAKFYESINDSLHLAEAYYLVGRANADMQHGEKALMYFQKALLCVPENTSPRLMSRIFAQTGYIYLRNGLLKEARQMQEMAHFYCQQIADTLSMRYCTEDMHTIDSLIQSNTVPESMSNEMLVKVQRIIEKVRSQQLSQQNRILKADYDKSKMWSWGMCGAVVVVIGICGMILRRRRKMRAEGNGTQIPDARHFYDKEVCSIIEERLKDDCPLKTSDWEIVGSCIDRAFPKFKETLYSQHNFSDTEYRICMLLRLEVSPSNIARLMAMSASSVSQARTRLQHKVFNGEGTAKDWDAYLQTVG